MIYTTILEYGIFPFAQLLTQTRFWSCTKKFKNLQWASQRELELRQIGKLRRILIHAYENVPFYNRKFKDNGFRPQDLRNREDLSKVPVSTKDDFRDNFPTKVTAKNVKRKRWKIDSTSGSTGKPLVFYRDKITDELKIASDVLFNSWARIEPGDKILWITHPRQIRYGGAYEYLMRLTWYKITRLHWLSVTEIQEDNLSAVVKFMNGVEPTCLYGYTSGLVMLANYLRKYDLQLNFNLKAIISSAETLLPYHKEMLEDVFQCDVFNRYGLRECGGSVAQDCEEHNGLHVNTELYYLEVVKDGETVSEGERGKVVITDLYNMVMPIIRYETGDIGVYGGNSCLCGRGFPTFQTIEGRETEFINIKTPSGKVITHPGYFFVLGDFTQHIKEYQFIQERLDELIIKVVPSESFDQNVANKITRFFTNIVGNEVIIKLEIVDEIPAEKSGKRPIVKSRIRFNF